MDVNSTVLSSLTFSLSFSCCRFCSICFISSLLRICHSLPVPHSCFPEQYTISSAPLPLFSTIFSSSSRNILFRSFLLFTLFFSLFHFQLGKNPILFAISFDVTSFSRCLPVFRFFPSFFLVFYLLYRL